MRRAPIPLAFWRAKRTLALETLSRESGVPLDTLATLEAGAVAADTGLYERLARILRVDPEDIAP